MDAELRGQVSAAGLSQRAQQAQQVQQAQQAGLSAGMQVPGQLSPMGIAFLTQLQAASTGGAQPAQLTPLSAALTQLAATPGYTGGRPSDGRVAHDGRLQTHSAAQHSAGSLAGAGSPASMGQLMAATQQPAAQGRGRSGISLSPLDARAPGSPPATGGRAAAAQLPSSFPASHASSSAPEQAGLPHLMARQAGQPSATVSQPVHWGPHSVQHSSGARAQVSCCPLVLDGLHLAAALCAQRRTAPGQKKLPSDTASTAAACEGSAVPFLPC